MTVRSLGTVDAANAPGTTTLAAIVTIPGRSGQSNSASRSTTRPPKDAASTTPQPIHCSRARSAADALRHRLR